MILTTLPRKLSPQLSPWPTAVSHIMKYDIAQKDYCNFLNTLTSLRPATG